MRWIPLLFALSSALPLHAEDFQKCQGEGGAIAYRGKGCLGGETLLAVIEPAADPPSIQRRAVEEPPSRQSRTARTTKHSQSSRAPAKKARRGRTRRSRKDPCTSAKQARDDFQRRRGIHVTMSELSRWNHRVYDACK